ncbi:hyphally regulated cell wall protein [Scheffersomyces xylosifermentans]|uniref:hyphally regulated cell wall protein n=1 Tax=Scheffersomyces xylosifermentans TaxID=1304137 RepID=UPI00315CD827
MLLKNFIVPALMSINGALSQEIKIDTVRDGLLSPNIGQLTVDKGVFYSIINNAITGFLGSLDIEGSFYITSSNDLLGLTIGLAGISNSILNNGVIVFNSAGSTLPPSYTLVGSSFTNNGEVYFGGDGSVGVPIMSITSTAWINRGLLVFSQKSRSTGVVTLGAPAGSITNQGQICLNNQVYQQTSAVVGTGCITAGHDSSVFIATSALQFAETQTIYLEENDSSLRVEALSTPQTFTVANFGNRNKIGLDIPLVSLTSDSPWDYDTATGILTLKGADLLSQKFNIGLGYDKSLFEVTTDTGVGLLSVPNGAIQYNAPAPKSGLPSACKACKTIPVAPTHV